jgi:hypothetical protein
MVNKHVVVTDAVVRRAAGPQIPHRLDQASRYDPRIGQTEIEQIVEQRVVDGVAQHRGVKILAAHGPASQIRRLR